MDWFSRTLAGQFYAMGIAEIAAVLFAICYLVLAIRQNIWCWLFAGLSTAIYVYLYAQINLYMESALNGFYFGMAIYGWKQWQAGTLLRDELPISKWPPHVHAKAIAAVVVVSAGCGYLLANFTDAAFPYIDSMTSFAAIWATFLVARKVLENWWYWLAIDVVSVFIYWSRDLELTALLFVFYVSIIPIGLISWTRSYRAQLV